MQRNKERTNKTIGEVLRLSKGATKKKLLRNLDLRLNYTAHTTTKTIPREIIHAKSIFNKELTPFLNIITTKNENTTIKNFYEVDELVYVKMVNSVKMEDTYEGPFKIIQSRGNWVEIDKGKTKVKSSVKHLRRGRM